MLACRCVWTTPDHSGCSLACTGLWPSWGFWVSKRCMKSRKILRVRQNTVKGISKKINSKNCVALEEAPVVSLCHQVELWVFVWFFFSGFIKVYQNQYSTTRDHTFFYSTLTFSLLCTIHPKTQDLSIPIMQPIASVWDTVNIGILQTQQFVRRSVRDRQRHQPGWHIGQYYCRHIRIHLCQLISRTVQKGQTRPYSKNSL